MESGMDGGGRQAEARGHSDSIKSTGNKGSYSKSAGNCISTPVFNMHL